MKQLYVLFTLLVALALTALAADINGKWTGQMSRGDRTVETTFVFKVDGEKLTGTVTDGRGGSQNIEDGKVSGDTVTFSVTTQRGKRTFTGKVSGAEIKFKREGGQNASEFTAKRAN
ncbi:MAG: hypothetical protein HY820_28095 [Acidobacteria bacterium]|nr:hypothetical protein [Acidobacteriota bacterium]